MLAQLMLLAVPGALAGLTVDLDDTASVKKAAAQVAADLMDYYTGTDSGGIPGILPQDDYEWWTGGALWASMIDYRDHTGDTSYDDKISEGLLFQRGSDGRDDFMPQNYTSEEGNDDQGMWALAALMANETGFAAPPSGDPQWFQLAQNVFDEQLDDARRVSECDGALRWQIYPFNSGYNYINVGSNGVFFDLAARIAWSTGNASAVTAAESTWEAMSKVGLIDEQYNVYDGVQISSCGSSASTNHLQATYTAGLVLEGAAYMFNSTGGGAGAGKWQTRVEGLLKRTLAVFSPGGDVLQEVACEPDSCTTDFTFFKAYLSRALAAAARLAPFTAADVRPVLRASAEAAVAQCTGGATGRLCGSNWHAGFDGNTGAGSEMSVLSALVSLMTTGNAPTATDGSSNATGTTDGTSSNSTGSDTPGSMGTQASISNLAAVGSLLLGVLIVI
ncbi:glycoside hydrolase family 76 protein [Xylariaceae sp. FL0804]|nr:glycoside hydrolase family 76 protein [Xylariaceae sp. FL0804]